MDCSVFWFGRKEIDWYVCHVGYVDMQWLRMGPVLTWAVARYG
jgi:hypothetical protein